MISILIPTYNYDVFSLVENLHKQCESSSITYEILVLDDASTDKEISDKNSRINSLPHSSFEVLDKNIGRSAIRNLLAEKASFKRLLFLDADVLPLDKNFILNYIPYLNASAEVICGGITYQGVKPTKAQMLRYVYGVKREEKSSAKRDMESHIIVSANILIWKNCFLEINTMLDNLYGDDLVLSQNIKKREFEVVHFENPVIHLGLESSEDYLEKSLMAVETIVHLEKNNFLQDNLTSLQKAHKKLTRFGALPLFQFIFKIFQSFAKKNLLSSSPSLIIFDMYRLHYYNQLKKDA